MNNNDIFDKLFEVIESRKGGDPESSYVARLLHKGVKKINSKVMEEAGETCEAALEKETGHLIYEICDLLFHTFVLAGARGVTLEEIRDELTRRFGTSGIEEKKNRKKE